MVDQKLQKYQKTKKQTKNTRKCKACFTISNISTHDAGFVNPPPPNKMKIETWRSIIIKAINLTTSQARGGNIKERLHNSNPTNHIYSRQHNSVHQPNKAIPLPKSTISFNINNFNFSVYLSTYFTLIEKQ